MILSHAGVLRRVGVPKRKAKEVMHLGAKASARGGFPQIYATPKCSTRTIQIGA